MPEKESPVKTLIKNQTIGSGKRECINIVELAIAEKAPKTLTCPTCWTNLGPI